MSLLPCSASSPSSLANNRWAGEKAQSVSSAGTATPTTLRLRMHSVGAHAASVMFCINKEYGLKFKEGCKIFRVQFPIYFIMGVLLLSGFWIFGDDTKEILKAAFFEHFAMKSIVF